MSTINSTSKVPTVKSKADKLAHENWMAGISYDVSNPLVKLRMAAASCFFGEPKYYGEGRVADAGHRAASAKSIVAKLAKSLGLGLPVEWVEQPKSSMLEKAIDEALTYDPKGTLEIAVALRHEDDIRVTPQVIMVRAAHHDKVRGTSLIREYAPKIMVRADEPSTQLAYQVQMYGGKPIPNSLKRAWKAFMERQGEYQLAKYRMESRLKKTVDVINVCHAKSDAIDKLMKGTLKLEENTWESLISAKGSTKEAWSEALDKFLLNPKGHMALLRNLRNLDSHGLVDAKVLQALKDGVAAGNQLPFRYWSAYNAMKAQSGVSGAILDAVEDCLKLSVSNVPHFEGKVASLCDNSGSAQGATTSELGSVKVNHIANLTGVITGMASEDGYVGIFGDKLDMQPVRKNSSIFDQVEKLNHIGAGIGQGTENGIWLFWDKAIKEKQHWDHVFIYSDMQAGHGGLYGLDASQYRGYTWGGSGKYIDVAKLVADYRAQVNKNVMVYMIQVAGYDDTLVPEVYDKTVVLGGWGSGILKYAHTLATIQKKTKP